MRSTLILLSSLLLLTGCATKVSDFAKMTPDQRATKTCRNAQELIELAKEVRNLQQSLSVSEGNVARGYALHTECTNYQVPDSSDTNCTYDMGVVHCSSQNHTRTQRQCRDVPVPINIEWEQKKLDSAKELMQSRYDYGCSLYGACYEKVLQMSPNQAFYYWKHHLLP